MKKRLAMMLAVAAAWSARADEPLAWPAVTRECKPWAYNWWHGSAVDAQSISNEFRRYAEGGLGGVHVIPIYGVKGEASRNVEYLTPAWMERFGRAAQAAERNGLGLDMTMGSGWCFGGPQVTRERGGWRLDVQSVALAAGQTCTNTFRREAVQGLVAVGPDGAVRDLMPDLDAQGRLSWRAERDGTRLVAVKADTAKAQAVKRAGPGGKGLMINPFDPVAMEQFLEPYARVFAADGTGVKPRAMYHDSYEYYGTAWSADFLAGFERHRGYRLQDEWAAFGGVGEPDHVARVKADYRETLSDRMVEEDFPIWTAWCRSRGMLTRNEAHGAPANLLDLYALADIPETEMFGHGGDDPLLSRFGPDFYKADRNPFVSKLASSAAHAKGTRYASAEFGTWLAEHFHETAEEIKCLADLNFLCGINHLFYHGTCFSPDDAAWPGWLFYASTEMNPRNPIWHDVPLLNAYITRVQSVMQSGTPANDVLLYWPIHDFWHEDGPYVRQLAVHDPQWMTNQPVGKTSASLWRLGYGFDYVSDRMLAGARTVNGAVVTAGGTAYRSVMVPVCSRMPVETFERLLRLAGDGACVIFCGDLPQDVPGWGNLEARRARLLALREGVRLEAAGVPGLGRAAVGKGTVFAGRGDEALRLAGVGRELEGAPEGLRTIRRRHAEGYHYLVVNHSMRRFDGWLRLSVPARSVVAMDAMDGRAGVAESRAGAGGGTDVRICLEPAASVLLRAFDTREVSGPAFRFVRAGPALAELDGPWQVRFAEGGPALPASFEGPLGSWTANGDPETQRFGGTAVYRTAFEVGDAWAGRPIVLDLGRVEVSARVRIDGAPAGHALMLPYRVALPQGLKAGPHAIEVDVTNLGANRIRDLDMRQVPWRIFEDINFVDIRYKGFDARQWSVRDSGLLGPVRVLEWRD